MKPDDPYSAFFVQPALAQHRRYEALRARLVETMPVKRITERFGLSPLTVDSQIRDFKRALDRGEAPEFFAAPCRQIAAELGRLAPTLFLTNNESLSGREIVKRYISRNAIENDLGINVSFFHLDCLSSEVRLNVNTDVAMTLLANGCYRWLSRRLKGCHNMEPKQLYREFVEAGGHLTVRGDQILVSLDRRSHNPIIAQAGLDRDSRSIPWLGGKRLCFHYK